MEVWAETSSRSLFLSSWWSPAGCSFGAATSDSERALVQLKQIRKDTSLKISSEEMSNHFSIITNTSPINLCWGVEDCLAAIISFIIVLLLTVREEMSHHHLPLSPVHMLWFPGSFSAHSRHPCQDLLSKCFRSISWQCPVNENIGQPPCSSRQDLSCSPRELWFVSVSVFETLAWHQLQLKLLPF